MKKAVSLAFIYAPCYTEWQCLYPVADKPNSDKSKVLTDKQP